jgi:hypothetical protein
MSKRASLTLVLMPAVLFGLLSFLSQTTAVSGSSLDSQPLSLPANPLLQGASETEPNDTVDTANPIAINLTVQGRIPLAQTGDIDWYRLVLSGADLGRDFRATLEELDPEAEYRLELNLYDSQGSLVQSASAASSTSVDWSSSVITYYLRVRATDFDTIVGKDAIYGLTVLRFAAQPTATPTATPVPWDKYEINDNINGTWSSNTPPGGPYQIAVGIELEDLNFVPYSGQPVPNDDYFTFLAKTGRTYRISTDVAGGADTEMWLYDSSNTQIAYDDDSGTDTGSRIELALNDGWYKILVRDRTASTSPATAQTYAVLVEDVTPATSTPTATPGPGTVTATSPPASIPGQPDAYEPNYDFDRATLIGLGAKYSNLNFVPWTGTQPDNDFYKLWVVSGKLYTCETLDLGTATNTNMILYSGPSSDLGFAGNDDVKPFDPNDPYRSRLTFFSSYDGYVFILLGQVGAERVLPQEWKNLTYSLQCYIDQPSTATPTPTSEFAPPTPRPTNTSAPDTPAPSPTPLQLEVRPMTTPQPPSTPTPAATPEPTLYNIELLLYYDRNQNGQADPDEGISSALARAHDAISGETLSINFTDALGRLRFQVATSGPVRVSVPFFGFSQVVTARDAEIQIRISPLP